MKKNKVILAFSFMVFIFVLAMSRSGSHSLKNEDGIRFEKEKEFRVELVNLSEGEAIETAEILSNFVIEDMGIKNGTFIFRNPGDFVTYTFDIVNDGDINASLKEIEIPEFSCNSLDGNEDVALSVCNKLSVDMSYTKMATRSVLKGDSLAAGTTTNITVSIIYNNDEESIDNVNVRLDNAMLKLGYESNDDAKDIVGQKN